MREPKNRALIRVTALCRQYVSAYNKTPAGMVILVDRETEEDLARLTAEDVGQHLAGRIKTRGVRATFDMLYGMRPMWGQEKLKIVEEIWR